MSGSHAPAGREQGNGFTLIELLVSMAVLALIVVLAATVVSMTSQTWTSGRNRIDNYSYARIVFDTLASDIYRAVVEEDLPNFAGAGSGLHFLSRVEVPGALRRATLVRYAWAPGGGSNNPIGLYRYAEPLGYGGSSGTNRVPFSRTAGATLPEPAATPDVVGPGVMAFDFRFVAADKSLGKVFKMPDTARTDPSATAAIEISLAILDDATLSLVESSGQLQEYLDVFQDAADNKSPAEEWKTNIAALTGPSRRGTRIYTRTISIPTPGR